MQIRVETKGYKNSSTADHAICLFSSPEPKVQVSFSEHNLSVVCSVVIVNFSHFILLKDNWANFSQTWHEVSLVFKFVQMKGPAPSQRRLLRNSENTLMKKKISSRTCGPISTKLSTKHLRVTGIQIYSIDGPCFF